ncbi:hypothetical protein CYMTET_36811 [Cymbomonas tetramitiformis]|uniref:Amino acid transporter transmembrane domain-containing protein n=1 Tax=Cymbomonas tetramitiformis TaxID=36881 RepID=A0AAE0F726_9CHLO|nr:hypothetical protein CYMTET_36811 [Cymbomonas tetramitiformis]
MHASAAFRLGNGALTRCDWMGVFVPSREEPQGEWEPNSFWRIVMSVAIVGGSVTMACNTPGVVTVWSLMGSTVSMMVAYILPCAAFLRLSPQSKSRFAVWTLLIASIIAAVAFTLASFYTMITGHGKPNSCAHIPEKSQM